MILDTIMRHCMPAFAKTTTRVNVVSPRSHHRVSPVPGTSQELLSDEVIEDHSARDLAQSEQPSRFRERESFAERFLEGTENGGD